MDSEKQPATESFDVKIGLREPASTGYYGGMNDGYRQCFQDVCLYGSVALAMVIFTVALLFRRE